MRSSTGPVVAQADLSPLRLLLRRCAMTVLVIDASVLAVVLGAMPVRRASHYPLLSRCWELRENLTIHDAAYVALAEALQVDLLTGDNRMARAPGPRCNIEVLSRG